jgi:hypothetical protein
LFLGYSSAVGLAMSGSINMMRAWDDVVIV